MSAEIGSEIRFTSKTYIDFAKELAQKLADYDIAYPDDPQLIAECIVEQSLLDGDYLFEIAEKLKDYFLTLRGMSVGDAIIETAKILRNAGLLNVNYDLYLLHSSFGKRYWGLRRRNWKYAALVRKRKLERKRAKAQAMAGKEEDGRKVSGVE